MNSSISNLNFIREVLVRADDKNLSDEQFIQFIKDTLPTIHYRPIPIKATFDEISTINFEYVTVDEFLSMLAYFLTHPINPQIFRKFVKNIINAVLNYVSNCRRAIFQLNKTLYYLKFNLQTIQKMYKLYNQVADLTIKNQIKAFADYASQVTDDVYNELNILQKDTNTIIKQLQKH